MAGHPVQADKGEVAECNAKGIMSSLCSAGKNPTCNGSFTQAHCDMYNVGEHGNWVFSDKFGKYITCPSGAVSKVCNSGKRSECRNPHNNKKMAYGIFCNTDMQVNKARGSCNYKVQKTENAVARCNPGQVITGRAASGKAADATLRGHKVFGWIKCCDVLSQPAMAKML